MLSPRLDTSSWLKSDIENGLDAETKLGTGRYSEEYKIIDFIANELITIYSVINFTLHPTIKDIRPIMWVNYGQKNNRYSVNIKYTSVLNISDFINYNNLDNILFDLLDTQRYNLKHKNFWSG